MDILDPWTFTGLLYGAMMPYAFSAMTMKSVGKAASDMVAECMRQFPKIISGRSSRSTLVALRSRLRRLFER